MRGSTITRRTKAGFAGAALLCAAAAVFLVLHGGDTTLYAQSNTEERASGTHDGGTDKPPANPDRGDTGNSTENSVTVYFFWGDGCPYCEQETAFLEELQKRRPEIEIHSFEVWHHPENVPVLRKLARAHGIQPRAVPMTFIGESHWVGFSPSIAAEMEAAIDACLQDGCRVPARP